MCYNRCNPMDCTVLGILQARILEWVAFAFSRIFPTQGSNPGLLRCRQTFLPAESQGKPKNAGVGSLFLLQQIFLTQESNWGSNSKGRLKENERESDMNYLSLRIKSF